jgi:hypothetical protein
MIFVAEFKFLTFKNEENALYAKSFYFANFEPPPPSPLKTDLKIRTTRFKVPLTSIILSSHSYELLK